jgi:hypothetical protein
LDTEQLETGFSMKFRRFFNKLLRNVLFHVEELLEVPSSEAN